MRDRAFSGKGLDRALLVQIISPGSRLDKQRPPGRADMPQAADLLTPLVGLSLADIEHASAVVYATDFEAVDAHLLRSAGQDCLEDHGVREGGAVDLPGVAAAPGGQYLTPSCASRCWCPRVAAASRNKTSVRC